MKSKTMRIVTIVLLLAVAGPIAAGTCEDEYCINWWTVDNGGEMLSESGDGQWQLSGSVGQWDATAARELSGGQWRLTGGFWGMTLEELADQLFRDRFEPAQ